MKSGKVKLMQGNEACAEGALAAGVTFFAGYPITPATEIAEILAAELPRRGGVFIQMEDELASMGAVIGASIGGAKSLTASSGPGISLKQENIGCAAMIEIPCVIVNVQRGGPSTGMPTLPAQMDVMQARWGSHGDHPMVAFCPSTVHEYYLLTIKAVNTAEMLRTPVMILSDAIVAHLREKVVLPQESEIEIINRKMTSASPEEYLPFKADEDGVPSFMDYGKGYRYHMTTNNHDEGGYPATNDHVIAEKLLTRLHEKIEKRKKDLIIVDEIMMDDAEIAVFAYGCTARSTNSAVEMGRKEGLKIGLLKTQTIWPFPEEYIKKYADRVHAIIVPEMNMGQMVGEVMKSAGGKTRIIPLNRIDGKMITPDQILQVAKGVKA